MPIRALHQNKMRLVATKTVVGLDSIPTNIFGMLVQQFVPLIYQSMVGQDHQFLVLEIFAVVNYCLMVYHYCRIQIILLFGYALLFTGEVIRTLWPLGGENASATGNSITSNESNGIIGLHSVLP